MVFSIHIYCHLSPNYYILLVLKVPPKMTAKNSTVTSCHHCHPTSSLIRNYDCINGSDSRNVTT
jgi:hypothetical protein